MLLLLLLLLGVAVALLLRLLLLLPLKLGEDLADDGPGSGRAEGGQCVVGGGSVRHHQRGGQVAQLGQHGIDGDDRVGGGDGQHIAEPAEETRVWLLQVVLILLLLLLQLLLPVQQLSDDAIVPGPSAVATPNRHGAAAATAAASLSRHQAVLCKLAGGSSF